MLSKLSFSFLLMGFPVHGLTLTVGLFWDIPAHMFTLFVMYSKPFFAKVNVERSSVYTGIATLK